MYSRFGLRSLLILTAQWQQKGQRALSPSAGPQFNNTNNCWEWYRFFEQSIKIDRCRRHSSCKSKRRKTPCTPISSFFIMKVWRDEKFFVPLHSELDFFDSKTIAYDTKRNNPFMRSSRTERNAANSDNTSGRLSREGYQTSPRGLLFWHR